MPIEYPKYSLGTVKCTENQFAGKLLLWLHVKLHEGTYHQLPKKLIEADDDCLVKMAETPPLKGGH